MRFRITTHFRTAAHGDCDLTKAPLQRGPPQIPRRPANMADILILRVPWRQTAELLCCCRLTALPGCMV